MTSYHEIMNSAFAGKEASIPALSPNVKECCEIEHDWMILLAARAGGELKRALERACAILERDLEAADRREACLLGAARGEASWTAIGGHQAALNVERLARLLRAAKVLTGRRRATAHDGYIEVATVLDVLAYAANRPEV